MPQGERNLLIFEKAGHSYVFFWDDASWIDCMNQIQRLVLCGVLSVNDWYACVQEGWATMQRKACNIKVRIAE